MAVSPAHRFGQILGEVLERAVESIVAEQAKKHHLYLDKRGERPCRKGAKLSWLDVNGNSHDLDFVLERGGTPTVQGVPAAFIEVAWRRYTKHSRAKAQEIQGAIMPLLEKHQRSAPFCGVILAGVFTEPSLQQLRSLGFSVLFIPMLSIVKAFATVGINAVVDEDTPDKECHRQVRLYKALSAKKKQGLAAALLNDHQQDVKQFTDAMEKVLSRQIERVVILPLYGAAIEFVSIKDALTSLQAFEKARNGESAAFVRYEIEVRYDNGNTLHGRFNDRESAIDFLSLYKSENSLSPAP